MAVFSDCALLSGPCVWVSSSRWLDEEHVEQHSFIPTQEDSIGAPRLMVELEPRLMGP